MQTVTAFKLMNYIPTVNLDVATLEVSLAKPRSFRIIDYLGSCEQEEHEEHYEHSQTDSGDKAQLGFSGNI
jgi:hypothetical protein